jgi:RHS repeat-associated protein
VIYSPFGEASYIWTNPGTIDIRFPGQWFQLESGLAYNWHRHYDATLGRYLQPDPIGLTTLLSDGPASYNYVHSNPLAFVDRQGLQELLFGRLPPLIESLLRNGARISEEDLKLDRTPIPRLSGKEGAKDVPDWCKGYRPRIDESGKDFAKRLLDERYGPGNWEKGQSTEFNRIQKWGDRSFRVPDWFINKYRT